MPLYQAPRWFRRELSLIDPTLSVAWSHRLCRWVIYHEDGTPSIIVQNPNTKAFYPLDNRILRKLRINRFFTRNSKALDSYLANDTFAMLAFTERGIAGVEAYLSGWGD